MAQEAALEAIANSKSRRILAFNNSFDSAGVRVGDEVPFYKAPPRKSPSRRRGPAKALLLDESGATVSFQGQTFKVAPHCVSKNVRASAESGASCEDAPGDLCRSALPREAPEKPPNPPSGYLDLYKRPIPLSPGPLSPDLAPLGNRARLGTSESPIGIGPSSQDPHCVASGDRWPFDPLMKYAHRPKVRRLRGRATMICPVGIFANRVSREAMQERAPKPPCARDYKRWMR